MAAVDVVAVVMPILAAGGVNVCTRLPAGAVRPIVRVEEAGGPPTTSRSPNRLTRQDLQIDVWGDDKPSASATARQVHDLLVAAPRTSAVQPAGTLVFTSVGRPSWQPDDDWPDPQGRPGPRYLLIVRAAAHD